MRTEPVQRSSIREMFDLAQSFDGDDLVHLEIGEPDFDTPDHVIEAATAAIDDGATQYTSNAGLPALRRAVGADLNGPYDPESELVITAGAMEALALAVTTLVNPGEEILVPTPAWPNYRTHAAMVDANPVEVPLPAETGFDLDPDRIADTMSDDTAAIILTTPSNPTGRVYAPSDVRAVVRAAVEHDAYVIADEVYRDLSYADRFRETATVTDHTEHVVTIGSCSKTYAMTGWRVGWLAAAESVIEPATKFHESIVACAPTVSQHAALAALDGDRRPAERMYDAFRKRRDYVVDRVEEIPEITCPRPEGAFYAFIDFSELGIGGDELARRLLYEQEVVTAPGTGFGSGFDAHLRISFAAGRDRLAEGFDRIERFVAAER
jgi:aspartate aminotransferase